MPHPLLGRLYIFAAALAFDSLFISTIPHTFALLGPLALCGIVAFAVFIALGYPQLKALQEDSVLSAGLFGAHFACVAAVWFANFAALRGFGPQLDSRADQLIARMVLLSGVVLLALACLPLRSWVAIVRATSPGWLFASVAGVLAGFLRLPFQSFWDASSNGFGSFLQTATFHSVGAVLRRFMPGVIVEPETFKVGTPRFLIIVAKQCSGIEGLGLVLVFTIVWLAYFRKESRFPQALLLVPCAMLCVWMLNVARICALVLIGNAGARDVAMLGFHSQAGWIAFTAVAFAFSMAARRLAWVRRRVPDAAISSGTPALAGVESESGFTASEIQESGESAASRAYLLPFLAILAASYLSKAASGGFEWLYPLRFIAAAIAIWAYRAELRKLDWRFGWIAPLTGAAVCLLWILPARAMGTPVPDSLGASLAALSLPARLTWIVFRIAAAAVTIPIAEELAFRGFLARRLIDQEFDHVPFSALTPLSIGISSVAFGLLYGQHWIAGIVAGLAYAAALRWRGRMGDAVAAHATSNLLLAVWVLVRGDFALW